MSQFLPPVREARKISRLWTLEHGLLSEYLRGVAPSKLSAKALLARETLLTERLLRKTSAGFVATKNAATLLDADARCPLCSKLTCREHPLRFSMEAMRHTRAVVAEVRKSRRAA
jgi:hypothetical protein